jgi:hypothetical protein
LPLPIVADCDRYLNERRQLLEQRLATVNRLAADLAPKKRIRY